MTDWKYKPALDIGMSYRKRLESRQRESGLLELILHQTLYRAIRLYLRRCQHLRVLHAERFPLEQPHIIVANHTSHLDALALGTFLPKGFQDTAHPLAAGDVFFANPVRSLFSAYLLNALPLWRGAYCGGALKTLRERLTQGSLRLFLFPEGTRSRTGCMGPFKQGIGSLVAATSIPVVPCWIEGAYQAWPPDRNWPRAGKLTVYVGHPHLFSEIPNTRDGWKRVAATLQSAVAALNPSTPPYPTTPPADSASSTKQADAL